MTEWDFITQRANEGAALEFEVDGESTNMSVGDYLKAVNAQGAARIAQQEKQEIAKAKAAQKRSNMLLYLAAGGAAILLLTR